MAKFIMSIGDEAYKLLGLEARNRDVTVQQLLRAVIVPEWIKENMELQPNAESPPLRQSIYGIQPRPNGNGNGGALVSPVNRLRH
ncbi:MAG TPA: hypothetical protein VE955_11045 [Candidatus Dormibacteraeota bacterium]|jgi:hypothetical protein|nr:hypothetical protein [Candidatus Dormibacteraeota bacterium]